MRDVRRKRVTAHLGIDVGTQSLKVVVLDSSGRVLAQAATAYPFLSLKPLWVEQSPAAWLESLRPTISLALGQAMLTPADILSVGVAGQLDGCVPVDVSGKPLANCLIWMDRRAQAELDDIPASLIQTRCGVAADASHMAAKIRWFKRNLADADRIARFHQPTTFIVEQLTGVATIDASLASTTMLYDAARQRFDPDLVQRFQTSIAELPTLRAASASAGRMTTRGAALTGLSEGTPVAVGTGDDFASMLGAGVMRPGTTVCSLGTAEVVGAIVPHRVVDPTGLLQSNPFFGDLHYIGHPGWLSGGSVQWLKHIILARSDESFHELAAAAAPGADGLTFLPALAGAVTPEWNAGARGCFYGLSTAHDQRHLARAVLEGCAFAMRDILDQLAAVGAETQRLLLIGGGARSSLWAQMRADVANRSVHFGLDHDTSAVGAAVLGAAALKAGSSLDAAAALLASAPLRLDPNPRDVAIYDTAYRRYRQLFAALRPLFV